MKAIIFRESIADCTLVADSAIGRDSQPLFLPDGAWQAMPVWAFRIGRLGKGIAPKFALRYVDAFTVALFVRPAGGELPSWAGFMDSAFTPGRWLPADAPCSDAAVEYGFRQVFAPLDAHTVESAIAAVTERATVKTGDIIAISSPGAAALDLKPNSVVTASIGRENVMRLKVK